MEYIKRNLDILLNKIEGTGCQLVAVTKTHPFEVLDYTYKLGFKRFGENKVQEMCDKQVQLPADVEWHLIGHLQSNKVKYAAPFTSLIHGVDSFSLLQEINKQALKNNRTIDCLLQLHIAQEETKFGLDESELKTILDNPAFYELKNIKIKGLMGMASNTDNQNQVRAEFRGLKTLWDSIIQNYQNERVDIQTLSMGMSGDYQIAIEEGSTLIRVGSAIFGNRG